MDGRVRYIDSPLENAIFSSEERAILDEINRRVAAADSIEKLIDFLFEQTRSISPCDRVSLALIDDDGRRVVAHYSRTVYEPVLLKKGYAEDIHGSTLQEVVSRGVPRIIDDLEKYLAAHPASPSTLILVKEGVRSSMTCPLSIEGRTVGLLFRSSRSACSYDDHQAMLHLAVAERLSQAVEKAWRIEQLTEANRSYTEMLGFVSHELKSPLAAIVMAGQVMIDSYVGELAPEQRRTVAGMIGKAEYLLSLVREYLDLAKIEGGELKINVRRGVEFYKTVVEHSMDIVRQQIENRKMQLDLEMDHEIKVSCDPNLLAIVMVNLIGNAAKYGSEGGRIIVRAKLDSEALKVSVWNEGPGFEDSDKALLFRRFSRLQKPELMRQKGTGIGLYTAWRVINLHGGRIWADSESGKWAEFSFTIPQA